MDVDQKTLERIAGALERIAKALEALPSSNASAIVASVAIKPAAPKAAPEEAKDISAKKMPQKQPTKKLKKTPAPSAKKTPQAPINSAKKKMAVLRKTPAGQQLSDFFGKLGLTILNPDAIDPIVEHQKFANAIWQFRSVSFDLMGKISSAIRQKTTHKVDLTGKTKGELSHFTSLCDSAKKAKLITYDHHENCIEIHPDGGHNNYFSGRWGEDVILTKTLRVANSLNSQQAKQLCSVFRNVGYKINGSEKPQDSECDVVLVVNGKFYFIEVKTGKQMNTAHYVEQVGHLDNKNEFSIYCSIDKEKAPEEIASLCVKPNFSIFDFEHFEDSLKDLIKKRQNYSFE